MTATVIDLNAKRLERATNSFKTMAEERGHAVYQAWKATGSPKDRTHYERDNELGQMIQSDPGDER